MQNFRGIVLSLVVLTSVLSAKDAKWQDGQVTQAIGAIPERGFYWIRGTNTTYVIHNYANGAMVQWWLHLTLGGPVRIFSDGKNLRVIDNQNKERKCQILHEMANPVADAYLAKEAAKTPEQLDADQARRDALRIQQEALRLQMLQNIAAQASSNKPTKVEVQVKDCSKLPALCQ